MDLRALMLVVLMLMTPLSGCFAPEETVEVTPAVAVEGIDGANGTLQVERGMYHTLSITSNVDYTVTPGPSMFLQDNTANWWANLTSRLKELSLYHDRPDHPRAKQLTQWLRQYAATLPDKSKANITINVTGWKEWLSAADGNFDPDDLAARQNAAAITARKEQEAAGRRPR